MTENEPVRARSVGATGGLPGAHADPRASRLAEDELASTVSRGDLPEGAVPDPDALSAAPDPDALEATGVPEPRALVRGFQHAHGNRDERGREIVDTPLPD